VSTGLRRTLVAGAVLLALASMLAVRLNAARISQHFYAQVSQATDVRLSADQSGLTLMHGIGLRLERVSMQHRQFQMQAGHMVVSLRLLPLLLGKIEVNTLDIHDATIVIQPDALQPTSAAISSLPVQRIALIRSQILTPDGKELLNNLHLDLRNIGLNRETLWELNAKQGDESISGNGRLLFRAGELTSGFGKLKLIRFPLLRLQSFVPATLMGWLQTEGELLDGAFTLDINKAQAWSLFGEASVENGKAVRTVSLRGKLNHAESGRLSWRDSFVHFGKHGVVAITGACQQGHCQTTLEAEQVPLSQWSQLLPAKLAWAHTIKSTTQLKADIQWQQASWRGHADMALSDASFHAGESDHPLPDMHLKIATLSGNADGWKTEMAITAAADDGLIHLQGGQQRHGDVSLDFDAKSAGAGLWSPLSNMLLASLQIKPALQATGKISGTLHLQQHGDASEVRSELNADAAQLTYPAWLVKPEGVAAHGQATIRWQGTKVVAAALKGWQLGEATLGRLDWQVNTRKAKKSALAETARQTLSIRQLNVDFDQLKERGVQLPALLPDWHGALSGSGSTNWPVQMAGKLPSKSNDQQMAGDEQQTAATAQQLPARKQQHTISEMAARLTGKWKLDGFGIDDWQTHGAVHAVRGRFASDRLQLDGRYGKATLQGSYQAATGRGEIDLLDGVLNRGVTDAVPSYWSQLSLKGRIRHAELLFLGNRWQDIQSRYKLARGRLMLQQFNATLAGGALTARQLALTARPDGLGVEGDLRAKNIRLHQLASLGDWLQADISGKLHANLLLHGTIGQSSPQAWQRSNGDMLIYDGSWQQRQAPATSPESGDKAAKPLPRHAFSKLEFRFRTKAEKTDISAIQLTSHRQHYRGKASVNADLQLHGEMHNPADNSRYRLEGALPRISWIAMPNKP